MSEEEKETTPEETVEIPVGKYVGKMRENPWIVATFVMALAFVLSLFFGGGAGVTGEVVNADEAAQNLVEFINSRGQGEADLVSVEQEGSLYKTVVNYQGQEVPVYLTMDGEFLVSNVVPLVDVPPVDNGTTPPPPADVPKSDRPKAEAFVFSYCPYGLQFQKAMVPVYKALKDVADLEIVAVGAMHGEYEKLESFREICIEEEYDKDKLWEYLEVFMGRTDIGDCRGNMECSDPFVSEVLKEVKIDETKINACMASDAQAIYDAQGARAKEFGISGSPSFVLNDVKINVGRTPEAVAGAICGAFNVAPEVCAGEFSSSAVTAGFGYTAGSDSGAQC